jgi:hypothetical protein
MTMIELKPPRPDCRDVAETNEMAILQLVRWYGRVRRSDIARAVWPRSTSRTAADMAQRTVARLLRTRQLNEHCYRSWNSLALARRGVDRLKVHGFDTRSGHDLSCTDGPEFSHRVLTTRYLIERSVLGHTAVSEVALGRGWSPLKLNALMRRYGMGPDGLVLVSGAARGYKDSVSAADWVVMRREGWTAAELKRAFAVAPHLGTPLAPGVVLDRLVIAHECRPSLSMLEIPMSVSRFLSRHPELSTVLPKIVLARCYVDVPLVWRGYEERSCASGA